MIAISLSTFSKTDWDNFSLLIILIATFFPVIQWTPNLTSPVCPFPRVFSSLYGPMYWAESGRTSSESRKREECLSLPDIVLCLWVDVFRWLRVGGISGRAGGWVVVVCLCWFRHSRSRKESHSDGDERVGEMGEPITSRIVTQIHNT